MADKDKKFGKGIPLAAGFDLGAQMPLDSRYQVATMQELVEHLDNNRAYRGMQVYVEEKNQVYYYTGEKWEVLVSTSNMVQYIDEMNLGDPCYFTGYEVPEDDKIWFFPAQNRTDTSYSYDDPIIDEIFAAIRTLQKQVQKLQTDVEYLKTHGGGRPPEEEEGEIYFLLEDGSGSLLTEEGAFLTLEESFIKVEEYLLMLEDGASFLLEDGSCILLEETIRQVNDTLLLLENGATLLLENGAYFKTEK